MRTITRDVLTLVVVAYLAVVIVLAVVTVRIPADYHYNQAIGTYIEFAKQQSTFDGMRQGVFVVKEKVNTLFPDKGAYNSAFYWDFVYKNTIDAQEKCYDQILDRIDTLEATYKRASLDTRNPTLLKDWYAEAITNIRDEMNSQGLSYYNCSLSYVVSQAYMVKYEPLGYWLVFYVSGLLLLSVPAFIFLGVQDTRKADREHNERNKGTEE